MYMADFPILKWMQVDGRSVPFTYPQHQKGNGYVVTGENNPLPTGNHVMTESGIWVPQRGTDEGAVHTQLTGSIVSLAMVGDAVTVADGAFLNLLLIENIKYKKIRIGVRWSSSNSNWRINVMHYATGTTVDPFRIDNITYESESVGDAEIEVYGGALTVRVQNNRGSDLDILKAEVLGVL